VAAGPAGLRRQARPFLKLIHARLPPLPLLAPPSEVAPGTPEVAIGRMALRGVARCWPGCRRTAKRHSGMARGDQRCQQRCIAMALKIVRTHLAAGGTRIKRHAQLELAACPTPQCQTAQCTTQELRPPRVTQTNTAQWRPPQRAAPSANRDGPIPCVRAGLPPQQTCVITRPTTPASPAAPIGPGHCRPTPDNVALRTRTRAIMMHPMRQNLAASTAPPVSSSFAGPHTLKKTRKGLHM
jgi:hypothetical protein